MEYASITVSDADGDDIRCRWATSSQRECSGVCQAFPATLTNVSLCNEYGKGYANERYCPLFSVHWFTLQIQSAMAGMQLLYKLKILHQHPAQLH